MKMEHHQWGTDPEARYRRWLERRARKARRILEVGVLAGKTTERLARATKGKVWAVDWWKGVPDDPMQDAIYRDPEGSRRAFFKRLAGPIEAGRVVVVEMASARAAAYLGARHGTEFFDLVFLDADHSYKGLRADILAFRPLVSDGGILSGHDITWPGVRRAVEELAPDFRRGGGSIWWTPIQRTEP